MAATKAQILEVEKGQESGENKDKAVGGGRTSGN